MVEISEIFSSFSQTRVLQDPMGACVQEWFFFKNLVFVLEMAILEQFMRKHIVVKELEGLTSNQLYQYFNVQKQKLDFEINFFIMCQKKGEKKLGGVYYNNLSILEKNRILEILEELSDL